MTRRSLLPSVLVCALLTPGVAAAQVNLTFMERHGGASAFLRRHDARFAPLSSLLLLGPDAAGGRRVDVVRGPAARDRGLTQGPLAVWAPPRRLALDQAGEMIGAWDARATGDVTGRGVVIGFVDSGLDLRHPDFLEADGRTRVAWWLDFGRPPAGAQPELEQALGCTATEGEWCAVWSAADLDAMREANAELPGDALGHGTHVASLAAGNGRASEPGRYVGVAPEATLVVANVTTTGAVGDAEIVLATAFVMERARAMGLPAVANLSLGSDFGPHDGSAPLGVALAELVDGVPGRAIVVAAGNSAGVLVDEDNRYPAPFGVHTEVHVAPGVATRVPVLTPKTHPEATETNAAVYAWLSFGAEDDVAVGVSRASGRAIAPVQPGHVAEWVEGPLAVTVANAGGGPDGPVASMRGGAVVVIDGVFEAGETFAVTLEGTGTADLWLQSEGDLSPLGPTLGAMFPRALKSGTINVPADHPSLIAVGATLNRTEWTDVTGEPVIIGRFGGVTDPEPGALAYFSSAGPNLLGGLKPDLVAPGAFVIGALAAAADPRLNDGIGEFSGVEQCGRIDCLVVDDHHAVSSGTSMSAPLVSGALALLFQLAPNLSGKEALRMLQTGAAPIDGRPSVEQQAGAGVLDVFGALEALGGGSRAPVSGAQSRLVLAGPAARPDGRSPVMALLQLRDASGRATDSATAADLAIDVAVGGVVAPLRRTAPGLWEFGVAAPAGTGGETLRIGVTLGGKLLLSRTLPIRVDAHSTNSNIAPRGGCTISTSPPVLHGTTLGALGALGALVALALRRSRRRRPDGGPDTQRRGAPDVHKFAR